MTQGSSWLATAGLRAGIPLGFSNGTQRRQDAEAQGKRESFFASPRLGASAFKFVAGLACLKKSQRDFVLQPSVATT